MGLPLPLLGLIFIPFRPFWVQFHTLLPPLVSPYLLPSFSLILLELRSVQNPAVISTNNMQEGILEKLYISRSCHLWWKITYFEERALLIFVKKAFTLPFDIAENYGIISLFTYIKNDHSCSLIILGFTCNRVNEYYSHFWEFNFLSWIALLMFVHACLKTKTR